MSTCFPLSPLINKYCPQLRLLVSPEKLHQGRRLFSRRHTSRAVTAPARELAFLLPDALERVTSSLVSSGTFPTFCKVHPAGVQPPPTQRTSASRTRDPSSWPSAKANSSPIPGCIIPVISRSGLISLIFLAAGSQSPSSPCASLKPPPPRYSSRLSRSAVIAGRHHLGCEHCVDRVVRNTGWSGCV